ncbi:hypothetical protein Btru_054858 [Bulinus truncatus]|nr:hypothetical protein Btru_054858 [Bulinus truncatus]
MSQSESPPASPSHEKRPVDDHCSDYTSCFDCTQDVECGYCTSHTDDDAPLMGACISVSKTDHNFAAWGRCSPSNSSGSFKEKNVIWAYETCLTVYSYFAIAGLILFVLSFAPGRSLIAPGRSLIAPGAGPMPWTINAEIYPSWCRSLANSIATVANWTCNLIVSVSFLALIDTITIWGTFLFFAVVCVAAAIFVVFLVPETKDKSLEDIQFLFMNSEEKLQIEAKHLTPSGSRHSKHSLVLQRRSQLTITQSTVAQPIILLPNAYRSSTGSTEIY